MTPTSGSFGSERGAMSKRKVCQVVAEPQEARPTQPHRTPTASTRHLRVETLRWAPSCKKKPRKSRCRRLKCASNTSPRLSCAVKELRFRTQVGFTKPAGHTWTHTRTTVISRWSVSLPLQHDWGALVQVSATACSWRWTETRREHMDRRRQAQPPLRERSGSLLKSSGNKVSSVTNLWMLLRSPDNKAKITESHLTPTLAHCLPPMAQPEEIFFLLLWAWWRNATKP